MISFLYTLLLMLQYQKTRKFGAKNLENKSENKEKLHFRSKFSYAKLFMTS